MADPQHKKPSQKTQPDTLPEEALDAMIGVLEGPVNRTAERLLRSRLVLVPLSATSNLALRVLRRVLGKRPGPHPGTFQNGGQR